jgi:hypothetical protein
MPLENSPERLKRFNKLNGVKSVSKEEFQRLVQIDRQNIRNYDTSALSVPEHESSPDLKVLAHIGDTEGLKIILRSSDHLEPSKRIELAETLLGHPLTPPQREALLAAHRVGEGEPEADGNPARIDNYTPQQSARKGLILRRGETEVRGPRTDADRNRPEVFSEGETKLLLDSGLAVA